MGRLAEAAVAVPGGTAPGLRCAVSLAYQDMDDDDRALFLAWLADPRIQHATISARLRHVGIDIRPSMIGRHRSGGNRCKCEVSSGLTG